VPDGAYRDGQIAPVAYALGLGSGPGEEVQLVAACSGQQGLDQSLFRPEEKQQDTRAGADGGRDELDLRTVASRADDAFAEGAR
jgi:hypothetical protein